MAFLSGKNNNFRFRFPKVFVPDAIEEKYRPFLQRIPGCMCESVIDFINYSIKNVEIQVSPNAYEPIEQIDRGTPYGRKYRSDAYPDMIFNKEMNISFQLDSAYLIWAILAELYLLYYCSEDAYLPSTPGFEILDCYGKVMYRITFDRLLFTSVSGLEFDFSSNTIEQKVINTTFMANRVDIKFEPDRI